MNKIFLIAIIIALIAVYANAKSLICAQCQSELCYTQNNCHLARPGLLGGTRPLDEDFDVEQKSKIWGKIGNALKQLDITVALEEENEQGKFWKKVGQVLKNVNVSVSFEEDEASYDLYNEDVEYGLQGSGSSVVATAKKHLGVKYVYGGNSWATGVDCSSFTQKVFQESVGISLPRTSSAQRSFHGTTIHGVANAHPGDLVFFPGHVTIYVGNNQVAHAPHTGSVTKIATIWATPDLIRRIL